MFYNEKYGRFIAVCPSQLMVKEVYLLDKTNLQLLNC
jgi:hypothetical protein